MLKLLIPPYSNFQLTWASMLASSCLHLARLVLYWSLSRMVSIMLSCRMALSFCSLLTSCRMLVLSIWSWWLCMTDSTTVTTALSWEARRPTRPARKNLLTAAALIGSSWSWTWFCTTASAIPTSAIACRQVRVQVNYWLQPANSSKLQARRSLC